MSDSSDNVGQPDPPRADQTTTPADTPTVPPVAAAPPTPADVTAVTNAEPSPSADQGASPPGQTVTSAGNGAGGAAAPPPQPMQAPPADGTGPVPPPDAAPAPLVPTGFTLPPWSLQHGIGVAAILLIIALAAFLAQPWLAQRGFVGAQWMHQSILGPDGRLVAWGVLLVLLTAFLAIIGHGLTGRWVGLLIDGRNRITLSRLQLIAWTVVVLSGYSIAVLWRLAASDIHGPTDILAVAIPQTLWLAMGISVTSLVGTPLILTTKTNNPPDPQQTANTLQLLVAEQAKAAQGGTVELLDGTQRLAIVKPPTAGSPGGVSVTHKGQLIVKAAPQDADWLDIFRGEETGNAAQFDLGKVQMFYFTVILVLAYMSSLFFMLTDTNLPKSLPVLDASAVALLALSHAGYLTNKALPHSSSPSPS